MPSRARLRPSPRLQPNLTSLIDVVFLLLVFFMLVTQLTSDQTINLKLPALHERQSAELPRDSRIIINVVPASQSVEAGGSYMLAGTPYAENDQGIASLAAALREAKSANPDVRVLLRAARNEAYSRVHPAMQAVTLAGVKQVDLVTIPPDDELQRAIAQ